MVIAFVPVRGGSKSIPLKNIKKICNEPLVYWILKSLQETQLVEKIVVATDSQEIEQTVQEFAFSKINIYHRKEENAQDTSTTESVILEYLMEQNISKEDIFLLAQATSPLTEVKHYTEALEKFFTENFDSILSCVRTKRFFWKENGTSKNYDYINRPRRQDFFGELMENGAIYINKVGNIIKDKNRLSGNIGIYEMPEYTAYEIDEPDDWIIVENLMYSKIKLNNNKIKLFLSDVDGVLTDGGMYYGNNGEEFKKFNTHDGKGFELLRNAGVKTGIITSENTKIVKNRAKKLKVDYLFQGKENLGKLEIAQKICDELKINLKDVAYIGDDINCKQLLENIGLAACPANAVTEIKEIPNIIQLTKAGGEGAVREFVGIIINRK